MTPDVLPDLFAHRFLYFRFSFGF